MGALRHQRRLDPVPRPRRRTTREARRAQAPVRHRGPQVQRAAARSAVRGAMEPRLRRETQSDRRSHPAAVRRDAPAPGERRHLHQEQVALGHRGDRRARLPCGWCHHRPRRQHRRMVALREGRQAPLLLQHGRSQLLRRRIGHPDLPRSPPEPTRPDSSSTTTAAGPARAAR